MGEDRERLAREWRAAQERLYPVVVHRPEAYERYVRAVRLVADGLRGVRTSEELAEAWDRREEIVAEALSGAGVGELDPDLVAGCAFGLRDQEIRAREAREAAERRIRLARERGEAWVTLEESGVPGDPPVPFPEPYRRTEMHLPDGRGLHLSVEEDPGTGRPVYGLQVVRLDPSTGAWLGDEGDRRTFPDATAWRDEADRARRRLSTSPP